MNWFGEDWGAPVCKTTEHTNTPVGKRCSRCNEPIEESDQGIILGGREYLWHIDCFCGVFVTSGVAADGDVEGTHRSRA